MAGPPYENVHVVFFFHLYLEETNKKINCQFL